MTRTIRPTNKSTWQKMSICLLFPLNNDFYPFLYFWQIFLVDYQLLWKKSSIDLLQELLLLKNEFCPFFAETTIEGNCESKNVQHNKISNKITTKGNSQFAPYTLALNDGFTIVCRYCSRQRESFKIRIFSKMRSSNKATWLKLSDS